MMTDSFDLVELWFWLSSEETPADPPNVSPEWWETLGPMMAEDLIGPN